MSENLMTTKQLTGLKAVGGKRMKRIGKVRRFVFHPTEKRCIGIMVKRPDAALMFHRKDLFVALDGFHVDDGGNVVIHDDSEATERGAVKALGVDWDQCVIWAGMPIMAESGDFLGYVDVVAFDSATGAVSWVTTENGAANDAIVGKRTIPAKLIRGFRRGKGIALAPMGEYSGEGDENPAETGAILVSDETLDLPIDGGVAAAAGKATAVVTNKAKQGAEKAKVEAARVSSTMGERAKPAVKKAAEKTEAAVEAGAFAAGKQLGKASGMFAAFKEEFEKAARGDDEGE